MEELWQAMVDRLMKQNSQKWGWLSQKKTEEPKMANGLLMVSINLPMANTFDDLKKITEKVASWKTSDYYAYCYETCKSGKPHSHLLLKVNNIGKFHQNLKRQKYAYSYGKGKPIKLDKFSSWLNGYRYLQGYKGTGMKPQHQQDIIFRKNNNLQDIYQSESCPSITTASQAKTATEKSELRSPEKSPDQM